MNHFFSQNLMSAPARIKALQTNAQCRLDKNEQSLDVDIYWKDKAIEALKESNWNRYPNADLSDIETNVAHYCGLDAANIALSPGSASLITTLLNYLAINGKKIVITHPSYSLFEYHCNTYNIPFIPWMLNENLEFEIENLPALDAQSVLIITSPNNPTGNSIRRDQLIEILQNNPETMVVIDGVYTEFANEDFTPLVKDYTNLMVLRSFSKAFPIAGLRLGYLCANEKLAGLVKKLMLPFSINAFTLCFAREVLFSPRFMAESKQKLKEIMAKRERMKQAIQSMDPLRKLKVYNSDGNFLLLKVYNETDHSMLLHTLQQKGIQILNTSTFTLLKNTIRVSIGNPQENELFLNCLSKITHCEPTVKSTPIPRYFTLPRALGTTLEKTQFN